jgi:hypothetical protein
MIDIYVKLIQRGLKTIDEVPEVIREQVKAELEKVQVNE